MKKVDRLKWKVRHYEDFLHAINYAVTAGNVNRVGELVDNAFRWGYAHRSGNGAYTDKEQQQMIDRATSDLCVERKRE